MHGEYCHSFMFPSRERSHRAHIVGIVRDTVEVIAIVAAGIWAFYVFVYENRIVPAMAQPDINYSATLEKVSRHNGLVGIQLQTEMHNVGTVRVHLLGYATAVLGERIEAVASPIPPLQTFQAVKFEPFSRTSDARVVYEEAQLTALADARVKKDDALDPGGDQRLETIFYVPENRFDRLTVYMVARYTRNEDRVTPTQLVIDKRGLPAFHVKPGSGAEQFADFLTELDLNGP